MSVFCKIAKNILLVFSIFFAIGISSIDAAKPKRIFMIHWLKTGRTTLGETFIKYLKEKNLNVEFIERFAYQDPVKLTEFINEAKQTKPDLVYVYSTGATLKVAGTWDAVDPKKNITDIPILAVAHSEPIATKIVKEVGAPTGRNLTGVSHYVPAPLSLQVMQNYKNNIKKIVVLSSNEANALSSNESIKKTAEAENITVVSIQYAIKNNEIEKGGIKEAVLKVLAEKPDMIYLPSDGYSEKNIQAVIKEFVANKHIHVAPIYTTLESMIGTENSCLFAYFNSFSDMGLMAGMKAEAILFEGKSVSEIPYEIGAKMSLAIRQDTMNALGSTPLVDLLESAEILTEKSGM